MLSFCYTFFMSCNLFPDERIDSTYHIDFESLYSEGIRGVIFDIDNTLVPHGAPADERAIALFDRLHVLGLKTMLLSNNGEARVKPFAEKTGSMYLHKAGKPKKTGYVKAMELMGTDNTDSIFVGDQIFTDVWGANRAGITTILVGKIHPREEIQIVLKRMLEFFVVGAFRLGRKIRGEPEARHVLREERLR